MNLLEVLRSGGAHVSKVFVEVDQPGCHQTEEGSETQNDKVPDTFAQWRFTSKERVLAAIFIEGGWYTIFGKDKARHGCF